MTVPKRVQLRRGVRLPEGARSVARPSRWGNPWRVVRLPGYRAVEWVVVNRGPYVDLDIDVGPFTSQERAHEVAVDLYARLVLPRLDLEPLRGWDLACYCGPGLPCHADTILDALYPKETP